MTQALTVHALTYGAEAASLAASGGGRVLAILSNAVYLESYEGYVAAVVGEDAADGPLSLRVRNLASLLDMLRGSQDGTFSIAGWDIDVAGLLTISTAHARPWVPAFPERLGALADRSEAAYSLAHLIARYGGSDTLGLQQRPSLVYLVTLCHSERSEESKELTLAPNHYLRFFASLRMTKGDGNSELQRQSPMDLVLARRASGIVGFVDALWRGDVTTACDSLTSLIGLGPGLTPSGDDFVSGAVAALLWQSRLGAISESVVGTIAADLRAAAARTNLISARLLHQACEGVLYGPAMELGAALLAGRTGNVAKPAARLFTIGHSTGLDMAAGLLVGCLGTLPIG